MKRVPGAYFTISDRLEINCRSLPSERCCQNVAARDLHEMTNRTRAMSDPANSDVYLPPDEGVVPPQEKSSAAL